MLDIKQQKQEQLPFTTLLEILQHRARFQPEKCAYIFLKNGEIESDRLTYRELWQQAHRIASSLRQDLR